MATMDIAIEIGTTFTSIYVSGEGVVLREPSVVAYYGDDKKLLAVGRDAWEKKGKTPNGTTVVCPVADGYVSDFDVTKDMVAQFIKRILPPSYVIFPKIRAILVVPTGLSVDERRIYEDAVLGAGVSECTLVENATAVALGTDLDLEKGGLVATIGGGVSEVALISSFGVIAGCSISVGGNMMDKALSDYLMGKYGVRIGSSTARKLKEEIGSLYPGDVASMDATGIGVDSFAPACVTVYAADVYEAVAPYYARVSEAVSSVMSQCPPELALEVAGEGLHLAGGGAKIAGVERVIGAGIGIPVKVGFDCELASMIGAGKLLGNSRLLKEILERA